MSGVIIANKDEIISISAPDIYGADFKLSIYSQTDNAWVLSNVQMSEYMDNFTVNEQTVQAVASKDDTVVTISDASNMSIGDVIIIKSYTYRITSIQGNNINVHFGLKEDLIIGDIANIAGNMSLYYIELNIADSGEYLIKAKDTIYGIDIVDSLKVTPKSIDTLAKEIKNLEYAILGQ